MLVTSQLRVASLRSQVGSENAWQIISPGTLRQPDDHLVGKRLVDSRRKYMPLLYVGDASLSCGISLCLVRLTIDLETATFLAHTNHVTNGFPLFLIFEVQCRILTS